MPICDKDKCHMSETSKMSSDEYKIPPGEVIKATQTTCPEDECPGGGQPGKTGKEKGIYHTHREDTGVMSCNGAHGEV